MARSRRGGRARHAGHAAARPRACTPRTSASWGVRDVLFGGRVSYVALAVLAIIALVIGFAGGWVGRKTAEVVGGVHHVEGDVAY